MRNEVVDHDVSMSEFAEHSTSTLPLLTITSTDHKSRSTVWDHFKRTVDDESKAQCQHCFKVIKCGNGTSAMRSHLRTCISNPTSDKSKRRKTGTSPSQEVDKHDVEFAREKFISMFIREELPFRLEKFGAEVAKESERNEKIAKKSLKVKSRAYAYASKEPMRTHCHALAVTS
ncbi:hypothetical protein PIB30_044950 [Stylosanthes scabra]|uniref:BED-type domain-containing protein n=1 Tax=Stylosanthes scabra TaxID=79078 RepID=A0ABU6RG14_9FABA|nr:hypothetical protein [Stylosanthes scabra]